MLLLLSLMVFRKNMKQKCSEELVPCKPVAEQLQCAWEMLAVLLQGAGGPESGIRWAARGKHFTSASPVTHTSL